MIDHTTFDGALSTDVLEAVVRVEGADEFPLTAFLLGANKKRITTSERFSWYASSLTARRGQINNGAGAYTSATTNLIVDNAAIFTPGDMLLAEATGEHLFVTGVSVGSNLIVVTRGAGSVAAHADSVADNAYLLNIGNAHGEGAGSPTHKTGNKVELYNFVQTFRQAVEISGRMNRIKTQTEDERTFQRKSAFEQLMRDGEQAMLFGARNNSLTDANGKRVTTMGG
ncbi:MAG: SU10 major capsid protein, partial [Phycisphaerales bacterium]